MEHTFHISEMFSKSPGADDEVILLDSGNIDLSEVTDRAFVGSIPIKYLCSEDCKGLCSVCGANLNRESCSCEEDNIDPRLAKLKEFIKD